MSVPALEYEIGDTTERSIPEPSVPEDTGVFVRPRAFPRPSSMYPMTAIEDESEAERVTPKPRLSICTR
jgi:hypothetical protein